MPFYFHQVIKANSNPFKTSNHNIEFSWDDNIWEDFIPFLFGCNQFHNLTLWQPFFKLIFPIAEGYFRGNN